MIRTNKELELFKENISLASLAFLLNFYAQLSREADFQGTLLIYNELEARIKAGGRING